MQPLTNAEVVSLWESAAPRTAAERALALVAAAAPSAGVDALARLSIGQRDLRLMELRAAMFGQRLELVGDCAACGAPFEVATRIGALIADTLRDDAAPPLELGVDGIHLRVRLPDSTDLAAASRAADSHAAARLLFERCVLSAVGDDGTPLAVDALPSTVMDAVAARLRDADPQAEVELALRCPECAHEWTATFDIAAFIWSELEASAGRLLVDVHTLARAYGWRERDILAMTSRRRQAYLDLIAG